MAETWPKIVVQLMHEVPRMRLTLSDYHTIEDEMLIVIDPGDIVTDEALDFLRANDRIET